MYVIPFYSLKANQVICRLIKLWLIGKLALITKECVLTFSTTILKLVMGDIVSKIDMVKKILGIFVKNDF